MRLGMWAIAAVIGLQTMVRAESCVSGPQQGERPGPYSFLVANGPEKGRQTCFVCETADRPGVIIFARTTAEPVGKLCSAVDRAVLARPKDAVRGWMTVLGEKTVTINALSKWGGDNGLKSLPIGIFDDPVGPPTYKLGTDADVTVLVFSKKKVEANFAFRAGELNDEAIKKILAAVEKTFSAK